MTNLHLLSVPFESNYKDTVYFATPTEQEDYMRNKRVSGLSFENFSYQRKDNIIRVPAHIDTLYKANYVAYQNKSISDKWYYAFIIDMKYVNEERTDITIQTDVMQTWMFDYTVQSSFVEREHVDDDTIGIHTQPEQLELGEYWCNSKTDKQMLVSAGVVIGATIDIAVKKQTWGSDAKYPDAHGEYYNGVYSGVRYFYMTDIEALNKKLDDVAKSGQSDGIVSMFMAPGHLIKAYIPDEEYYIERYGPNGHWADLVGFSGLESNVYFVESSKDVTRTSWDYFIDGVNDDIVPEKPTSLMDYTPRNNKLLTYPYCYLLASNNSGGANIYHYEKFSGQPEFGIVSAITPGMSVRLIPQHYDGMIENNLEGLNLGKYPICAWTTDVYTNWLTQNSVNIGVSIASGIGQTVMGGLTTILGIVSSPVGGGALAGVGGGTMMGGLTQIGNTLGEIKQHSHIPPAVEGNINSGDVTFANRDLTFTLYQMSIKKEYAQIIDEYFDMFGYKVNRVKVPNSNHRAFYWFTKTIDVNIDGAIPNTDMDKIKECYNRGITFWKPYAKMGVYHSDTQNNSLK